MQHLEKQITVKQAWIEVETDNGTEYLDAAELGLMIRDSQTVTHPLTDKEREQITAKLSPYVTGTIQEWKTIRGYGARMSAPGYLDCTDWTVFDTAEEAEKYLEEAYGEEENEECELMEVSGSPKGNAIGTCKCGRTIYQSHLAGNPYHSEEEA